MMLNEKIFDAKSQLDQLKNEHSTQIDQINLEKQAEVAEMNSKMEKSGTQTNMIHLM